MNFLRVFTLILISWSLSGCKSDEEKLKEHVLGTWFSTNGSTTYSGNPLQRNPAIGADVLYFTGDSLFIEFSNSISTSSNNAYTLENDILSFNNMLFYFPHEPVGKHDLDCKYSVVFESATELEYTHKNCYEKLAVRYKISNDSIIYHIDSATYSGKAIRISDDTLRLLWHDENISNVYDYYRMPEGTSLSHGELFDREKLATGNPGTCTFCFDGNKWKKSGSYSGKVNYVENYTPLTFPEEIDLSSGNQTPHSWHGFVLEYQHYFLEVYDYTGSELHLVPVLSASTADRIQFVYHTNQVIIYKRDYE